MSVGLFLKSARVIHQQLVQHTLKKNGIIFISLLALICDFNSKPHETFLNGFMDLNSFKNLAKLLTLSKIMRTLLS